VEVTPSLKEAPKGQLMTSHIQKSFQESKNLIESILADQSIFNQISEAIDLFTTTFKQGGKVLSCGNGGSLSDAMHFCEELTGKFRKDRRPLPAIAINDPGYLSCVSNDYSYDHVFARYLEAMGKEGDALLAISTSGQSPNVIKAASYAQDHGIKVISLTGKDGGELIKVSDIALVVPSQVTDKIQEIHIQIIHSFIEGIERNLFPENY